MNREETLKRIRDAARKDKRRRTDPRYRTTIGFLVAKGFLDTNEAVARIPNQRIKIADAIWAGTHVEPRILEVLPAAILRLPRHFDLSRERHPELIALVEKLRRGETNGPNLWKIPYKKFAYWTSLPLPDRRTKLPNERRIVKTFRLKPESIARLQALCTALGCNATEALETVLLRATGKE
jgi:hypothetical protein